MLLSDQGRAGSDRRPQRSNETIAADFKHFAAAAGYDRPHDLQATFETGLEMLLQRIERLIENMNG